MLDVQRRPDVDAGGQQLLDVLPALGMARARDIGVGAFVHQQEPRPPGQGGVDVELHQGAPAIGDRLSRQDFQPLEQGRGLGSPVGFHHPHQHLGPLRLPPPGLLQHLVGLAHARRHAEKDLEPAAPGPLRFLQQRIRIGATRLVEGHGVGACAFARVASRSRLVFSTFTRGCPMKPRNGSSTWAEITLRTALAGTPRALAIRSACSSA